MNNIAIRPEYELPATIEDLSRFVLVGREKLTAVRAEIRAIEKLGLAKEVREQKLQEAQLISEAMLDAEVRIGQLMNSVPKATNNNPSGNNQYRGQKDSGVVLTKSSSNPEPEEKIPEEIIPENSPEESNEGSIEDSIEETIEEDNADVMPEILEPEIIEPEISEAAESADERAASPKTKAEVIRESGFSPKQAQRFQQLAEHPEIVEAAKKEARENDDIVSRSLVLKKIKEKKRKADLQRQIEELEESQPIVPDGLFDVIVMDPPWAYGTGYDADGRRCANPYPEMTLGNLKAINLPASENSVLFLWTTHKFIWDAKELLDTWGFEYRNMLVWDKKVMGMGNLFRMRCEFCIIGIKGKPIFKDVHNLEDIIEEKRREHSRKPEAFYELVDTLCVGRKLDYFSRTQREGWEVYGNDTNKFSVA